MKTAILIAFIFLILPQKSISQNTQRQNGNSTVLFGDFLNAQNKVDTIAVLNRLDFFSFFKILNCSSGNLYFSGSGFDQVILIRYSGKADDLKNYFERCKRGSQLTLENCAIPRDGGLNPIVLNKTILFQ